MKFKTELVEQITKLSKVKDIEHLLDVNPPQGDFALPCFKFAKEFKCNPKQAADKLVELLELPPFISKIETGAIEIANGDSAVEVMKILDLATKSLKT